MGDEVWRDDYPEGVVVPKLSFEEQADRVNELFLEHNPAEHLLIRLRLLAATHDRLDELGSVVSGEFHIEGVDLGMTDAPTKEEAWRFVTVESVVLLHTAAESLLRLFFAMLDDRWTPWVGIAEARNFREFTKRVEAWQSLADDEAATDVSYAVYRRRLGPDHEAIGTIVDIVRDAARIWIDEGDLYNAVKHGFAAVAGGSRVEFRPADDSIAPVVFGDGRVLETLTVRKGVGRHDRNWISLPRNMVQVLLICQTITEMWRTARAYYRVDEEWPTPEAPTATYREAMGSLFTEGRGRMSGPLIFVPTESKGDSGGPPSESGT